MGGHKLPAGFLLVCAVIKQTDGVVGQFVRNMDARAVDVDHITYDQANANIIYVSEELITVECLGVETRIDCYNLNEAYVDNCKNDEEQLPVPQPHGSLNSQYWSEERCYGLYELPQSQEAGLLLRADKAGYKRIEGHLDESVSYPYQGESQYHGDNAVGYKWNYESQQGDHHAQKNRFLPSYPVHHYAGRH